MPSTEPLARTRLDYTHEMTAGGDATPSRAGRGQRQGADSEGVRPELLIRESDMHLPLTRWPVAARAALVVDVPGLPQLCHGVTAAQEPDGGWLAVIAAFSGGLLVQTSCNRAVCNMPVSDDITLVREAPKQIRKGSRHDALPRPIMALAGFGDQEVGSSNLPTPTRSRT